MARILIIDDEEGIRFTFKTFLTQQGHEAITAADYATATAAITSLSRLDLIFIDIILDSDSGLSILKLVKDQGINCPVIIITGQPDVSTASEALRLGAFDYIVKPIRKEMLLRITDLALKHMKLANEKEKYQRHMEAVFRSVTDAIITVDPQMRIIEANPAAETIFQRPLGNMIGLALGDALDRSVYPFEKPISRSLEKGDVIRDHQVECLHPDGMHQVLMINASPLINQDRKPMGALLVVRDITRITYMESQLREKNSFHNIIGKSARMQKIFDIAQILSGVETTVLVSGESGTGKELLARAIHYQGPRSDKPLVVVNCSTLSENLLESELFGHVRGAFTGATSDRRGCFQSANRGTLFLDEIGDISASTQLKLLRVLQEKEFCRVGDSQSIRVDVRIIAATNRRLAEEVGRGRFREDLFYRIKVMEIVIPPLRERIEDIPLLANHFLDMFNNIFHKNIQGIDKASTRVFMSYPWHGNVRELKNAMEHAFIMCRGDTIQLEDFPSEIATHAPPFGRRADIAAERNEEEMIRHHLNTTGWNKAKAARAIGVSRKTLYKKMKAHKIQDPTDRVS